MIVNRTCAPIPAVLAAMFLLGSGACTDRAQEEPHGSNAVGKGEDSGVVYASVELSPQEIEEIQSHWTRRIMPYDPGRDNWGAAATERDAQNRFLPAVIVSTPLGNQCSGALVAPRLVLTAGNCVCKGRKQSAPGGGQQTLIDSTSCAASATVWTKVYGSLPATGPSGQVINYNGEVRPHPGLKIILDAAGNIISSEADLAVIQIAGSPVDRVPPLALADVDLRVDESLVMLGYDARGGLGERRFGQYQVTRILDAGARALFDQPRRDVFKGDSGGPCIRETDHGMVLVGILNRSLGAEASFTSTFHYRDWIREQIQRVADDSPGPR